MFEKLGKFEIERLLGHGAMGEVYLGRDPSIGREVAIKTILSTATRGEEAKERFAREARAAGVLNHPNLVTIYEFGEDQGVLFIAMEYVKGHDLDELLQQQSLSRSESLEVLAQVCDGLGFAHRQRIVHRDIKPANIRVQRDGRRLQAKVMDFGVARISDSEMTATGMVMGTVSYMAPEYIQTGKPDPRSDLFAVGVMLYECLSGRKPFAGDTTPTVLYKIVNELPDPIDIEHLRDISPAIRSVLDRALCKNPDDRYQTAEDLARALRAAKDPSWLGHLDEATSLLRAAAPTAAVPVAIPAPIGPGGSGTYHPQVGPPIPVATRPDGHRTLWLGAAALVLLGLGLSGWLWLGRAGRGGAPPLAPRAEVRPVPAPVQEAPKPSEQAPTALPSSSPAPRTVAPTPASTPALKSGVIAPVEPVRPSPPPPSEPKGIEQPDLYRAEVLDKLQVHERQNLGNLALSEAIRQADSQPEQAIRGLRQALRADPDNINAHAWLATLLYDQGRLDAFVQELREARRQGILGQMGARNARFRAILGRARLARKLPADLMD
jgi:serine/threonine-protein kinase